MTITSIQFQYISDVIKADPRTMHVLENHLPDVPLRPLQNLAAYLVPSEVYHDDINTLHVRLSILERIGSMVSKQ